MKTYHQLFFIFVMLNVLILHHVQAQQASALESVKVNEIFSGEMNDEKSELRGLIERYSSDRETLGRSYPISMSVVRSKKFNELSEIWNARLQLINFDSLSQNGKIDYLLLKNYLRHEQRQQKIQQQTFDEIYPLLPFAGEILALEDSRRHMDTMNVEKIAELLSSLNKKIDSVKQSIDKMLQEKDRNTLLKRSIANRAVSMTLNLNDALKLWFEYYNGYDPFFTWWVERPYRAVETSLRSYAELLREKVVGVKAGDKTTIIGDPIGKEALLSELEYEMIPYTPEELVTIANQEYAWCENEMKRASRDLGYGDDWKKALEVVKTKHVEPGKQPELIRNLALEAIKFVDDHNLVTAPPLARDVWRMKMLSPERQLVSPFFLGGEVIQVAFPTNTMEHEQKMMSLRGNNIHFARATVFHELIPGHHLQGFMMDRHRNYRSLFYTPFWVEGGALYWEMLFWDLGFPKTPENRIGMLFWRMHRCARIIFSLSFHLGKMTPGECIDFLVDRVGHERDNATAEVRRSFGGDYAPLYQCAYMLGALQLRALRKEVVDGGKMSEREFHDAVLYENAIPIEMIRADLTHQKLPKDFTTNWKFYGNVAAKSK